MEYRNEVEINLPVDRVIELMDNPDNMQAWQPGLLRYELLSENLRAEGAQMKLVFERGKGEMEMIETIVRYDFPEHFDATYETDGVYNRVSNTFLPTSENSTKWISENEFQFDSIPMKLMGALMPWMFKKQSQKYMDLFKEFAENAEEEQNKSPA